MASGKHRLSAAKVAKCRTPGYLLDGGNLYLQVTMRSNRNTDGKPRSPAEQVTKSWTFRYKDRTTGKLRELGLGSYEVISLERAREKAAELRNLLADGKDPMAVRAAQKVAVKIANAKGMTFDEAAARCIADKRAGWKNQKHADQWTNTLATYVSPVFGAVSVSEIDLDMVRKVLDPIWTDKNETASRVRQRIEAVLSWAAVITGHKGENPARWRGHLDHIYAKPSKVKLVEHHRAMPYAEVSAFIENLRSRNGVAALALEFLILNANRTNEVTGARWEEFDIKARIWTIPPERMKARKEHLVPLSGRALAIIQLLKDASAGPFVFPGDKPGAPLSNAAMDVLRKRMGYTDITVHGFRSTFRDWAGDLMEFPREIVEHALAHQLKDKAEAAYARSTQIEKRRKVMEAWAEFCSTPWKNHEA